MMREKRKSANANERQRAIFRLGDLLEEASELLMASIVWGDGYPELCECLDEMAGEIAEEIRFLGRWMLRRGIDPPIARLCQTSLRRESSIDGVIRSVVEKEEAALRLWQKGSDGFDAFSPTGAEDRIRRLRRLLS